MASFIVFGIGGWQRVAQDELEVLQDGVLRTEDDDLVLGPDARSKFFRSGLVTDEPGFEYQLNDLVIGFVASGVAATSSASDCFIRLGQEERRAISMGDLGLLAQQRVREAALGFNLLATRSTWSPKVRSGFPYRTRDWVLWCDARIEDMDKSAEQLYDLDLPSSVQFRRAGDDLRMIRQAFSQAPSRRNTESETSSNGCYIATSIYGDYDAPEVVTLRQWRDGVLRPRRFGRAFISIYYAVSPRLVRSVGSRNWFRRPTRWVLDRFVRQVAKGMARR